jgi:hypothetical protein
MAHEQENPLSQEWERHRIDAHAHMHTVADVCNPTKKEMGQMLVIWTRTFISEEMADDMAAEFRRYKHGT